MSDAPKSDAVAVAPENALAALQSAAFGDDMFKEAGAGELFIGFLPRLQLFTANSNEVKRGKITLAHYGMISGKDKVLTDLGKTVIMYPLAWRPKALDTKSDPVMAYHNPVSPEFVALKKRADASSDSGCMYGPEFLVYLKEHGYVTFFFGSKTARNEAPKLRALLPTGTGPFRPALVQAQFIETKEYSWHAPQVMPTTQSFELPSNEEINSVGMVFLKPKDSEVVEKAETAAVNTDR